MKGARFAQFVKTKTCRTLERFAGGLVCTTRSANNTRAREAQADTLADEILDIADDATNDFMMTEQGLKYDGDSVQRSRLRVDSRKWLAGKLRPKKYGDKIETEHTGGQTFTVVTGVPRDS